MEQGKQLLMEINEARARPQDCIEDIKQQLARFESNTVMRTRKGDKLRVVEGKSAWQDAILFLERQKPKEPLTWSKELTETAQAYITVRTTSDPNPFKLLKSRYTYEASISFNVNETEVPQTLRELVVAMIVGDGDEKKGNRSTLFNPSYSHFGGVVEKSKEGMFVPMFFSETGKFEPKASIHGTHEKQQTKGNKVIYTDRGKELVAELNRIRKDPKSIINQLKSDLDKFKDEKTLVKDNLTIKTKEGRAGYLDLISELEEQYPIPLLKLSEGLCAASADQVVELELEEQSQGKSEEPPTNYLSLIKKYCLQSESINNIIMNRSEEDPYSNMLILLLVGDGDRKRSARRKLLSPVLKVVGAAVGETYFVINVGESVRDNKQAIEAGLKSPQKESLKETLHKEPVLSSSSKATVHKPQPTEKPFKPAQEEEQRVIKKKTTKSVTVTRGGKHYKQTTTKILYADGEIEELQEEELLDD